MQILYVDDDADDREIFTAAVSAIDPAIHVLEFESGSKALAYLFSTSIVPDYIFIDYNMPKVNGADCVQQIKSKSNLSSAQLVMYSTSFSPSVVEELGNFEVRWVNKASDFGGIIGSIQGVIDAGSVHR